jgi:hypothetical protein
VVVEEKEHVGDEVLRKNPTDRAAKPAGVVKARQ